MFKLFRFINIFRMIKNSYRYISDPKIPKKYKLIPFAAIIYFILPIDFLPELRILGLGYIDDFFLVYILLRWFENLCEKYIKSQEFIKTEYKVKEREEDK